MRTGFLSKDFFKEKDINDDPEKKRFLSEIRIRFFPVFKGFCNDTLVNFLFDMLQAT